MNTRELIENSLLDAMGLLDEKETQEFERAFRSASPTVQSHVRREQTRLAHIEHLLPQVEPPAELRAAVIEAVRVEMELALEQATEQTRSPLFTLLPSQRVSAMWRAAAIGFMTAAVVFGTTTLNTRKIFDEIEASMIGNQFEEWVMSDQNLAEKYYFNDNTRHASFSQGTAAVQSKAVLLIQAESNEAAFHCRSLPASLIGKSCKLVEIDADGNSTTLLTFEYTGAVIFKEVSVKLDPENSFSIQELTTDIVPNNSMLSTRSVSELNDLSLL